MFLHGVACQKSASFPNRFLFREQLKTLSFERAKSGECDG